MRLDGEALRARRLQLGQTIRGLAREVLVSQTLIKRLEDTGELGAVTCATLQRLAEALSVELVDLLVRHEPPADPDERVLERLGSILLERRSGIPAVALGALLGIDTPALDAQLEYLAVQLRPLGIRVHRGTSGVRLVQGKQADRFDSADDQYLDLPTNADLRLLHRAMSRTVHSRDVGMMKNGNVSLHRLLKARLVRIREDGALELGPTAQTSFGLDSSS